MTATLYARVDRAIEGVIQEQRVSDQALAAYMVARAALLRVRAVRGSVAAAEVAYRMADELAVTP
ncbi:MAG: hypothetical protein JOZ27_07170 [Caulobacteraceae bacterium]|nr:hypothetical protein [Caulobacteraceae bacterium]